MAKKYIGEKMAESSRFIRYLETMSSEQRTKVAGKVDLFIKENAEYCDKGNYQHLCNIFTSMALYSTLVEAKVEPDEAENTVFETMYAYMQTQREKFQKLSKKNWFWSVIKKIVPMGFKMGSGYGWKYTWYKDNPNKNEFKFECNSCIYQQIFKKYGFERFGPKFCHNDIIVYGELERTDFARTGTICRGNDKCDFKFTRYAKDEQFERSRSV
ncbi:MAG: L-2-amino-thiazoline-4-carboxylic acid hydrolase [Clostridiales bacterium]|nr:L-2-amino-thiazoline-4-carboxylic acid hydrolase [Clostridiales bacterium]